MEPHLDLDFYTPLIDENQSRQSFDHESGIQRKQNKLVPRLFVWSCFMSVFAAALFMNSRNQSSDDTVSTYGNKQRTHTHPTPLFIVDAVTGEYLLAFDNPLYKQVQEAEFVEESAAEPSQDEKFQNIVEAPTLSLDRTLIQIREPVTLSWSLGRDAVGNALMNDDDLVLLFCPASEQDPRRFYEAATLAQVRATSQKHGGSREEWLIPSFPVMRQETCQFRLYKSEDSYHKKRLHLMAKSPILSTPDSKRTPTAIHLAWTNDTSEMVVQYVTGESGKPVAMYGTNDPKTKVEGTSQTYEAIDMCQAPANETDVGKFQPPGWLHVVKLTNLEPNTTYHYKVGLAAGQGITWSDVYSFTSAPPVGDERPFSYIVYGDQGCPSVGWGDGGLWTSAMATREIDSNNESLPITQVHHLGDLSYARGAAHIWDDWFHMIQPFASRVPLSVGVGNHEYDHSEGGDNGRDPSFVNTSHGFMPSWGNYGDDSGGECGTPISRRFEMPPNGNGVFWYSHDYASLRTIMLSSEHNMSIGSPQYEWLEYQLKNVNRSITPWLAVEMHRPLYHSANFWDQNMVDMGLRYEVEDLLYDYQVDLLLSGHYHSYLRTCDGLYKGKCDNGGPTHITVGTAGAFLDAGTLYEQDWTMAFRNQNHGYGRITVMNRTALHFEFVKAGPENDPTAGDILDDVWIVRDR